jgi:diacylglycerol kinase family enzyme
VAALPSRPSIALLANPESGSGDAAEAVRLLRELGGDVLELPPDRSDEAARAGVERIVVAGGDGSIGPAAAAAGEAGVPLAVIPAGTANDFARAMGLPDELAAACRLALSGETTRRLELGRVGDRPFVNVTSAGLPPAAARKAKGLKGALGPLAYTAGALRAGLGARPVRCSVVCDGTPVHDGEAWQVTAACTGAFGGGAAVDADPADGALDLVVIPAGSRLGLLRRAYGLRSGRIQDQTGVRACRRQATVTGSGQFDLNVDGELIRTASAEIGVEPAAYELVVG